jgi:hypothetical protein
MRVVFSLNSLSWSLFLHEKGGGQEIFICSTLSTRKTIKASQYGHQIQVIPF